MDGLRAKVDTDGLADRYGPMLYRFCRSLAFSKEDGEDLFQDTFLKALERPRKLMEDPKNFLFSTALGLWRSRRRKYARRERIAPLEPLEDRDLPGGDDPEASLLAREEERRVRQTVAVAPGVTRTDMVAALPERYRLPLVLYYSMEMKVADIALTLGLPVGTVKRRLHTARALVEKGLGEDEN